VPASLTACLDIAYSIQSMLMDINVQWDGKGSVLHFPQKVRSYRTGHGFALKIILKQRTLAPESTIPVQGGSSATDANMSSVAAAELVRVGC